jgi:hypothetical protein
MATSRSTKTKKKLVFFNTTFTFHIIMLAKLPNPLDTLHSANAP